MASQKDLDRVLIESARLWSTLSTCSRLSVGCVIADSRGRIVSSGYNGAPAGAEHCNHSCDCGHEFEPDPRWYHLSWCKFKQPCTVAVHSEANAIKYAPESVYFATERYTMYCSHSPCQNCSKEIIDTGITRVVYLQQYRDISHLDMLSDAGIRVEQYKGG